MVSVMASGAWFEQAPIVDVVPNRRVWLRRVARTVSLLVALGRVWWPIWLPALVGLMVVSWWLVAVVLVVSVAGLAALVSRVRSWLVGLPIATGEALFRWRWPRIASQASIVAAADGAIRTPRLVEVELHGRPWKPDSARLVVEPLAVQHEDSWTRLANMLARQLRFAINTALPLDALTLEVRMRRDRLPDLVALGADLPLSAVAPRPGVVALGDSSLGGRVEWHWDDPTRTRLFIAGGTGGGKSNEIRKVLGWVMERRAVGELVTGFVIDGKGMGDYDWCQSQGWVTVVDDPRDSALAFGFLRRDLDRRAALLKARGLSSWLQLPPEDVAEFGGRLVVIVDEFVNVINTKVMVPLSELLPKDDTDTDTDGGDAAKGRGGRRPRGRGEVVDLMRVGQDDFQAVMSKGRAAGMNIVLSTQHPIAEHMGTWGSTLLANVTARIGVGGLEPSGAGALFGKSHGELISARLKAAKPGRFYYQGLSSGAESGGPVLGHGWYASDEFVAGLTPTPAPAPAAVLGPVDDVVIEFPAAGDDGLGDNSGDDGEGVA